MLISIVTWPQSFARTVTTGILFCMLCSPYTICQLLQLRVMSSNSLCPAFSPSAPLAGWSSLLRSSSLAPCSFFLISSSLDEFCLTFCCLPPIFTVYRRFKFFDLFFTAPARLFLLLSISRSDDRFSLTLCYLLRIFTVYRQFIFFASLLPRLG
jgi:hypothetical protein